MTLLNILQKADLSFFSSKKLKAITNGTFLLQQLEYSQKPFGNACCICKKIYFFNHVLCPKWGLIMFKVASQLSYPHYFHKIDKIVFHSVELELN